MIDIEKVIRAVESCFDYWLDKHGYLSQLELEHVRQIKADALALLKEREAKWIHREDLDFKDKGCNHFHGMCGNCGFIHDFIDGHTGQYRYCPQCGKTVKWE